MKIHYYLKTFRKFIIIALKKIEKKDYIISKLWRFIVFFCIIKKVFESILILKLNYIVKKHNLLLDIHFGNKKTKLSNDVMYILIKRIYVVWKRKEIITILFLNIFETFDNVFHEKLLHNLKKRRMFTNLIKYIISFVSERSTKLRFSNQFLNWKIKTKIL